MELQAKVEVGSCPRCGNMGYLECAEREHVDEDLAGYHLYFQFCFECGYSGRDLNRVSAERIPIQGDGFSRTFSGLCCLKLKDGSTEHYGIFGDSAEEVISWFSAILKQPDIEPNGSCLNKWDEGTKTILKISPNFDKNQAD